MRRGDIYWATLEPRSGSEQQGTRPVVVVSHDAFNETPDWRSVIVVPLTTSTARSARGPTTIRLPKGSAGLDRESIALCHQVTTLDRSKLTQLVGRLSESELVLLGQGLRIAQDLG